MKKILILALALAAQAAYADFELKDSAGKRILLRDNGTWTYLDADGKPILTKTTGSADLELSARVDAPGSCRFDLTLTNNLPYEIGSLVPEFSIYRNNVVYATKSLGFSSLKPGDKRNRFLIFEGIACAEIGKLQVLGGDRCEMGELNKFADARGQCLAQVKVMPSGLLKFEK